eukprot:EG_transcript_18431
MSRSTSYHGLRDQQFPSVTPSSSLYSPAEISSSLVSSALTSARDTAHNPRPHGVEHELAPFPPSVATTTHPANGAPRTMTAPPPPPLEPPAQSNHGNGTVSTTYTSPRQPPPHPLSPYTHGAEWTPMDGAAAAAPANTPQLEPLGAAPADRNSSLTTEDSLPPDGPKRKRPAGTRLWRPGHLAGALWRWLPMIAVRLLALLGLALVVFAVVMVFVTLQDQDDPSKVELRGKQLYVDGQPYIVRGVNYNPIFKGHDGRLPPYGEYFGRDYSESSFFGRSLSTLYTPDSFWQGIANIFTPPPSYHESHLRELSKTFNTIRIYQWSRDVSHRAFLDLCH